MPSTIGLAVSVSLFATSILSHPLFHGQVISRAEDLLPEYDYVVVGAGASGLTVANRLSENKNVNVLVIEAGDFDQNEDYMTIPGLAGGAVGTKYDWKFTYAPNPHLNNRAIPLGQGKAVGGGTKLNAMTFDRGSQSDYDTWETLGAKGWNYRSLLPYFKKSETFTPATPAIQAEYNIKVDLNNRGSNGPIQLTFPPFFWADYDIPINDESSGRALGGYYRPKNQDPKTETRSSAQEAYYAPAKPRSNYHLLAGNQVTQVITSKTNGLPKVTGVKFATSANAPVQQAKAKKEVILAAGALRTPHLLQISGIGDASLLASINVPTVVNLPAVGHNLHDHASIFMSFALNTDLPTSLVLQSNATFAAEAHRQYDASRSGPLTNPRGEFLLFLPHSTLSNNTKALVSQAAANGASASLRQNVPAEVARGYAAQFSALNKKMVATDAAMMEITWVDGSVGSILQHPFSRGQVIAPSSSAFDYPIADPGVYRNNIDSAMMREGVSFIRKIMATSSMGGLKPTEAAPGASADVDAWIRSTTICIYHPAGTAKIGRREDGGVVDENLKVYGVQGLRVVDASVMPMVPAAHIMATVYAVAERAADIIKGGK